MPAEQLRHKIEPRSLENVPDAQGVQNVAPISVEDVPARHGMGSDIPREGQKVPPGHCLHVLLLEAPREGEDVPLGQDSRALRESLQLVEHSV